MHRPNHDIWGRSSGDAPYGSLLTTHANMPLSSSAPAYAASSPGGTALPYDAASLALLTLFDSHHSHSPSIRHSSTHHHPYQFRRDSLDSASVSASVSCVRLGLGLGLGLGAGGNPISPSTMPPLVFNDSSEGCAPARDVSRRPASREGHPCHMATCRVETSIRERRTQTI